jgi:hypothetical protein
MRVVMAIDRSPSLGGVQRYVVDLRGVFWRFA